MKHTRTMALFAVLVASAAVSGAYAQSAPSNTERIASIHESTDSILDMVTGIVDTLNGMLASLGSLTSGVAQINSSITGFGSTLDVIAATAEVNSKTLSGMSAILSGMSSDMESIKGSLAGQDGGDISGSISFLTDTVNRNQVSVDDRLRAIEITLADIKEKLDGTSVSSGVSPGTDLIRSSKQIQVSDYTYKSRGTSTTYNAAPVYTLEMTFSCTGTVSVDKVTTTVTRNSNKIFDTGTPDRLTKVNYLQVDGRDLYHSKFETSPNTYQVYDRDVEFNLSPLAPGSTLRFLSQQHTGNPDNNPGVINITGSSQSDSEFMYTVEVSYLATRDTSCDIVAGSGVNNAEPLSQTGTVLVPAAFNMNDTLRPFSNTVSCGDNPVEITKIQASPVETWPQHLTAFSSFDLTILDGTNDSVPDYRIGFDGTGSLNAVDYPISFSKADLRISGKAPQIDQMLIQIDYRTVSGGSCSSQ